MVYMNIKTRLGFAKHAAPEAINVQIAKTVRELRKLAKHLSFLSELQITRAKQIKAGEWPAKA